jgi:hypothetical protein
MSRSPLLAALPLVLAPACGDDGTPLMTPDAPPADAQCTLPPGVSWIFTTAHVVPADQGFDLDGDTTIDNVLGAAPNAVRSGANDGLDAAIAGGELLMVMLMTDWSDPPTPDDPDLRFNAFQVYDADMPADSSNNLSGQGRFVVPISQLDLQCRSKTEADETTLVGGVLTARRDSWRFTLTTGLGALEFADAIIVTTFSSDFATGTSRLGAVMSLCTLSALAFPGDTPGTVLDALVNDEGIGSQVMIDMDRDGDGLEQVRGDGVGVLDCVDGDGTVIDGADCPCHPAIVDGYSVGMEFLAVTAQVVGTI